MRVMRAVLVAIVTVALVFSSQSAWSDTQTSTTWTAPGTVVGVASVDWSDTVYGGSYRLEFSPVAGHTYRTVTRYIETTQECIFINQERLLSERYYMVLDDSNSGAMVVQTSTGVTFCGQITITTDVASLWTWEAGAPPTSAITFPVDSTPYNLASWNTNNGQIRGTAQAGDPQFPVTGVQVSIRQKSSGRYWDQDGGFDSAAEVFLSATFDSGTGIWTYLFTPPSDGDYVIRSKALAGSAEQDPPVAVDPVTYDNTKPKGVDITGMPSAWSGTATATIVCDDGTGSGCQVSSYLLHNAGTAGATCPNSKSAYTITPTSTPTHTVSNYMVLCAWAEDQAGNGNFTTKGKEFKVDVTPPTGTLAIVPLDSPDTEFTNITGVDLRITTGDGGQSGVANPGCEYRNGDSGTWSAKEACGTTKSWTLAAGAGLKTVQLRVTDNVGLTTTISDTITVDTAQPAVTLTAPPANSYSAKKTPTISATATDASGISSCTFSIDSGTQTGTLAHGTGDTYTGTAPSLGEGAHTVAVVCMDKAGNWKDTPAASFTVDSIVPTFSGYTRSPDPPAAAEDVVVGVTLSETPDTVILEWNGEKNFTVSTHTGPRYEMTVKRSGNYSAHNLVTYIWYANDSAGSTGKSSDQSFIVKNTPPAISFISIGPLDPKTNDLLTCTISGVSDADNDPLSTTWEWFVNDEHVFITVTNTLTMTNTLDLSKAGFGDRGDAITCAATVADAYGGSARKTSSAATVQNSPPTITDFPAELNWPKGSSYSLDTGLFFSDPDGDPLTLTTTRPADITIAIDSADGIITFSAADDFFCEPPSCSRSVAITASDGEATVSTGSIPIIIPAENTPPRIAIVLPADQTVVEVGALIPLNTTAADDDGNTLSFQWNFGDGEVRSGRQNETKIYTSPGTYTITITASDGLETASDSVTVIVRDTRPPAVEVQYNATPLLGESVNVTATITDFSPIRAVTLAFGGAILTPISENRQTDFHWVMEWRIHVTALGSQNFTITANDTAGNSGKYIFALSLAECSGAATRPCGTDEGVCTAGTQICASGTWSACSGSVGPFNETCDAEDNDCDGLTDEGVSCSCIPGQTQPCGIAVGACAAGIQTCGENAVWGACSGTIASPEICDGTDNDCDGVTDEGGNCCVPGTKSECGPDTDAGICQRGIKSCGLDFSWGSCVGAVNADVIDACGDGLDNDCDGEADETCQSCRNGVQDADEDGVDCGAVCGPVCGSDGGNSGPFLIVGGLAIIGVIGFLFFRFRAQGRQLTWGELKTKWEY